MLRWLVDYGIALILAQAGERKVMEVALAHGTVDELDRLSRDSLSQTVNHGSADLVLGAHRIDDLTADVACDPTRRRRPP